jgi:uncharacterized protein YndB with AHSA1/START domain
MGTLSKQGNVSVVVDATPEAVWDVVADPTRVGEWSHECRTAVWLDGATGASPGARFRGGNKTGRFGWHRSNEVLAVDPPHELVWRTIPTRRYNDSTEWRLRVEAVDGGTRTRTRTRIEQSFRVLKLGPIADRLFYLLVPAHRDRLAALEDDLRRIGEVARTGQPAVTHR